MVKETIGKDLPEGFQRSEFLLEHGFLDAIVERKDLKEKVAFSLRAMGDFAKAGIKTPKALDGAVVHCIFAPQFFA